MKIFACVVSFNPSIERLYLCIKAIENNVDRLLIFDNGSQNYSLIEKMVKDFGSKSVELIKSPVNIGLSSALQLLYEKSKNNGAEWILTLDQDTICPSNLVSTLSAHCSDNVGIVSPLFFDKRRNCNKPIIENIVKEVSFCITSGSLTSIKALNAIGGYDTNLFIDLIDNDLCYRLIKSGYSILEDHSLIIDHELGEIRKAKLGSFYMSLFRVFHFDWLRKMSYKRVVSPLRMRYAVRNMIYLNEKHHGSNVNDWSKKTLRETIRSGLIRSHFNTDIRKAIKQGKKEGLELVNKLVAQNNRQL